MRPPPSDLFHPSNLQNRLQRFAADEEALEWYADLVVSRLGADTPCTITSAPYILGGVVLDTEPADQDQNQENVGIDFENC